MSERIRKATISREHRGVSTMSPMMRAAICRDGGAYVNEPYEDSNVSMNFSVQASSGDINLRLDE